MSRHALSWCVFLCLVAGCETLNPSSPKTPPNAGPRSTTELVPTNPFDNPAPSPGVPRAALTAGSLEASARVDALGQKILCANPQIGVRPVFRTIGPPVATASWKPGGGPGPALFHHQTDEIYVTEDLVKQCTTEGQLAAVLCYELARMVAEQQATANLHASLPERPPTIDVPIGEDTRGAFGPADQTHLAELAKYDRRRPAPSAAPARLPDPDALARIYLDKAGYPRTDLDEATPLLRTASENTAFKQLMRHQ